MTEEPLRQAMEALFDRVVDPDADTLTALSELIALVRPPRPGDASHASDRLGTLADLLETRPEYAAALRECLGSLLSTRKHLSLYVDAGIFPNTGFVGEIRRRIAHKILPEVPDRANLRDVLGTLFDRPSDAEWVAAVDDATWLRILDGLGVDTTPDVRALPHWAQQVLEALQILSYRISALGLEPELVRVDPDLERFASPFVAQNVEMLAFLETYRRTWLDPEVAFRSDRHLHVLLDQCRTVIARVRRLASNNGTSIHLTFTLERLRQHLDRTGHLLEILETVWERPDGRAVLVPAVRLFKRLVAAECRKNTLLHYMRQNVSILALRVADHAGRKGGHYISSNRAEYAAMARSALLGGLVITFMSLFKVLMAYLHLPPLTEALVFCLNYGLGFVLIHVIHGTVATKQPAMTANAIAATLGDPGGKGRDLEALTTLIARTTRTQMVAILGNVGVALPLAMLVSLAAQQAFGVHIATPEKAREMLHDVHPLFSGAVFYAAIAGFWLFLSGLVAGYYDNVSAYARVPERLGAARWLRRVLGPDRQARLAEYVRGNLGALMGNFLFGFMLGGSYAVGSLFGVPFDIRHVAFSSAFIGFGIAGKGFTPAGADLAGALIGLFLVGTTNLVVSFTLALMVALRARQVTFAQRRQLVSSVVARLRRQPWEFFLPPRR